MDAIDLMILNESVVAAAAGAPPSINQLYNLLGVFQDRSKAFHELYAELGALREILETLHMNLDGSSSRITKIQQLVLEECRRLLEACKIVCDRYYAELSDVWQHSTL